MASGLGPPTTPARPLESPSPASSGASTIPIPGATSTSASAAVEGRMIHGSGKRDLPVTSARRRRWPAIGARPHLHLSKRPARNLDSSGVGSGGMQPWARQGSNLRPRHYECPALPLSYGPESSGGETRTLNHTVNSRVLCQLSYPGRFSPENISARTRRSVQRQGPSR